MRETPFFAGAALHRSVSYSRSTSRDVDLGLNLEFSGLKEAIEVSDLERFRHMRHQMLVTTLTLRGQIWSDDLLAS